MKLRHLDLQEQNEIYSLSCFKITAATVTLKSYLLFENWFVIWNDKAPAASYGILWTCQSEPL